MSFERRRFVKKSLLGLLAVSLVPSSFSIAGSRRKLSVDSLFKQLSFEKKYLTNNFVASNFKLVESEGCTISRNGNVYKHGKTYAVQEFNHYCSGFKDQMISIYEKGANGFDKVLTMSEIELRTLSDMVEELHGQGVYTSDELQALLVPTFRTKKHLGSRSYVDGRAASQHGYFTSRGYCSINIRAERSRYTVHSELLNFKGAKQYSANLVFNGVA